MPVLPVILVPQVCLLLTLTSHGTTSRNLVYVVFERLLYNKQAKITTDIKRLFLPCQQLDI